MPNVTTDSHGANYFDRSTNIQYILLRGPTPLDIKTSPLIVVSFNMPAMSSDDFYGEELVNNLAAFLGIPASKIKVAEAVREGSRRKRSSHTILVKLEISNQPGNGTANTTIDTGIGVKFLMLEFFSEMPKA